MKRTTPTITIIILFAIVASLVSCCTASYFPPQCPLRIMPSRATRSTQGAARRRQDDEASTAAILQNVKKMIDSKRRMEMIRTQLKFLSLRLSLLTLRPISPLFLPVTLARKWGIRRRRTWTSIHRMSNSSKTVSNLPKRRNPKK
jgi:hypothetical protein